MRGGISLFGALLLFSGISNLNTFGFHFPLYLLWLGSFYAMGARRAPRDGASVGAVRATGSIAPNGSVRLSRRKVGI